MKSLTVTIQKKIAKQRLPVAVYNTVQGGFDISVIWVKSKATDQYIAVVFAWFAIVFCIFFPLRFKLHIADNTYLGRMCRIFPKVNFNKWMKIKNVSEIIIRRSITED